MKFGYRSIRSMKLRNETADVDVSFFSSVTTVYLRSERTRKKRISSQTKYSKVNVQILDYVLRYLAHYVLLGFRHYISSECPKSERQIVREFNIVRFLV